MCPGKMAIVVNEEWMIVSKNLKLGKLKNWLKPDADIMIVNGFPAGEDTQIEGGDTIVFIRRGEVPRNEEMEALLVARHTPGVHARMKEATIGIAGLGGLGSSVAIVLARMGMGKLILADFDVVEPSNLNRQQYNIGHIGMAKTEAMVDILRKINPYVEVICHNLVLTSLNVPKIYQDAKIIIECFDRAEAKAMLVDAVTRFLPETYVVCASGVAGFGCSNDIRTIKIADKVFAVGDWVTEAEPGRGLMAPRVGIAAHHQANLAVDLLMNDRKDI